MLSINQLGRTDLKLTAIGLGTWAIGGPWQYGWGSQQEEDSIASLLEGLEGGINWIDTAPAYGLGMAETVVGKVLKQWKQPVIVATKCGLIPSPDTPGSVFSSLAYDSIKREAEASLQRLGIDCIDLYQIHWPKPEAEIEEAFLAITDLQKEGKIRYGAVSNFSIPQMQRILKQSCIASNQIPFSLMDRRMESHTMPFCLEHHIGVLAYSPLKNGLLTGKCSPAWRDKLEADDYRKQYNPAFADPEFTINLAFVESLTSIALEYGEDVSQLAVEWVLNNTAVTSAIIGVRKKGHIKPFLKLQSKMDTGKQQKIMQSLATYKRALQEAFRE